MTTQGNAEATLNASRSEQLAPYLDLLRPDPENGRPEVPSTLTMGETELVLDAWERTILQKAAALSQEVYPWSDRVAEGVAFLAWRRSRLDDPGEVPRDDLVLAVAIGLAVLEDLQRDIDGLVLAGRMGLAKQLTTFRHKVSQEFCGLKDAIGPEEMKEAEDLSRTLVPPVTRSRPMLVEEEPEGPVQFRRDPPRTTARPLPVPTKKRRKGSRVRTLSVVLALSAAAWLGFAATRPTVKTIPEIDASKFPRLGVTSVVQRPPSLFVTVQDAHWHGLSAEQRREMVQQFVDVVTPVGYRGVQVRLESGPTAAEWLQQGGIQLVESAPGEGT